MFPFDDGTMNALEDALSTTGWRTIIYNICWMLFHIWTENVWNLHSPAHNSVNQPLYAWQASDLWLKCPLNDGNPNRTPAWHYNMKRDYRRHSKFCTRCINMFVIFIMWDSFGKQGQEVLSHPRRHVIASPYPQKWVLSHHRDIFDGRFRAISS